MINDTEPHKGVDEENMSRPAPARIGYRADLEDIPDHIFNLAQQREQHLLAYLAIENRSREDAVALSKLFGLGLTQTYKLRNDYIENPDLISLMPEKRTGGKGKSRLDPETNAIIERSIDDVYATRAKRKVFKVIQEVRIRCRKLSLKAPSENTVRARIRSRSPRQPLAAREGDKIAAESYDLIKGSFPEQKWPLSTVQYDHTRMNIQIVDPETLKPIGRPWITIGYDVKTKCVVGMHMSMAAPDSVAVGLVIVNTIIPKSEWLHQLKLDTDWPMYGKPDVIHVDNGKDFRSKAVERACAKHRITLEYRPLGKTEYGGGVERSFRTLMSEIEDLDGSTFANIQQKGKYDSEGNAIYTFDDIQEIMIIFITKIYHERKHHGLPGKIPPRKAWEVGIFGDPGADILGRGMPLVINNQRHLLIEFLKQERRNIRREGIVLDYMHYSDDVLTAFIAKGHTKRQIIKRDPRDLSVIFLLDPETGEYYDIPYRDMSRPPITLWEHKLSLKLARDRLVDEINEDIIFEGIDEIRGVTKNAKTRKKAHKRAMAAEAKTKWAKDSVILNPVSYKSQAEASAPIKEDGFEYEDAINIDEDDTFDEIEFL